MDKRIKPILKWAGGKRQLLDHIIPLINDKLSENNTYFEPFFGGGAVLFALQPKKAVINDYNTELIIMYDTIKNSPKELINELSRHKNTKEYFYKIRKWDREPNYSNRTNVEKAARTIYLNKTCFNGLYRVNLNGEFNVPFANNVNPLIVDNMTINGLNYYFNSNDIQMLNLDFEEAINDAKKGDFVYFDPPYAPVSKTSSFTSYTKDAFGKDEQIRLRDLAKKLYDNGINFLISNSDTKEIKDLYSDKNYFKIVKVKVNRNINSKANLRRGVTEVLIYNAEKNGK